MTLTPSRRSSVRCAEVMAARANLLARIYGQPRQADLPGNGTDVHDRAAALAQIRYGQLGQRKRREKIQFENGARFTERSSDGRRNKSLAPRC